MNMKHSVRNITHPNFVIGFLVAVLLALLVASCNDGGDGPSGNSTVTGSVRTFSTGSALYLPEARANAVVRLVRGLGDLLVPAAKAHVQGVQVTIEGTDLSTSTAEDGTFIISGVPAGTQTIVFDFEQITATLTIVIPTNAVIHLNNVDVFTTSVSTGKTVVVKVDRTEIEEFDDDDHEGENEHGD